jgi:hypothetical protein
LPSQQLWQAAAPEGDDVYADIGRRAIPYRAPTWSWVSVDLFDDMRVCSAYISYDNAHSVIDASGKIDERFGVLEGACTVEGANPYGCVTDGYLRVHGAVIATTLCYKEYGIFTTDDDASDYDWWLLIPGPFKKERIHFEYDIRNHGDQDIPEGSTIYAMLIGVSIENLGYAILLSPSGTKFGKFERVSIITIDKKAFTGAGEMTLDIV